MLDRFKLSMLLQGLTLFLFSPAYEASSLGLTVHVVPLDSEGGERVRAHFTAIAPSPCPALTGLCAAGEDCVLHSTALPFNGTKPNSGWCVRQWQKTVASDYRDTIDLGSNTKIYVSMNVVPTYRENSNRLNQPAFVALPPPLRARVNCPHHFHLSVKDLDGDKVRCRFARPDQGECLNCTEHPFIELDEGKCMLTFTGTAAAGQYFIHLMAEDLTPAPKSSLITDITPLSSVPVHLSLTVEESTSSCSAEALTEDVTPKQGSVLFVLPFQEVKFKVNYLSKLESVLEVAVVGPLELYRVGFKTVGPLAEMTMSWVRSINNLTRLVPICFAANTKSLQSEPRCVWLYQREMRTLPAGTELKCENTEMTLVLPVASLTDIDLAELQLNSPTCPITYNSTHLTARISLTGCGTKTVHSGSELVYTNILHSVRPYTKVSRQPSLILPLACRIPEAQVKGPHYKIGMPTEKETFGEVSVWLDFYLPGEGPLRKFTETPQFRSNYMSIKRVRREAESGTGSSNSTSTSGGRIKTLDLHVMSNCSVDQAELLVSKCVRSETADFAESHLIVDQGCMVSNSTLEIITTKNNTKIYRLDLNIMAATGSKMYFECTVNLCIPTMPSLKCPNLCTRSISHRVLVGSVFTNSYTVRSRPVSLMITTPAPTTTTTTTTTEPTTTATVTTTTAAQNSTTSHAPQQGLSMATGVILTTVSIFLQKITPC